jgi:hypothetical protein
MFLPAIALGAGKPIHKEYQQYRQRNKVRREIDRCIAETRQAADESLGIAACDVRLTKDLVRLCSFITPQERADLLKQLDGALTVIEKRITARDAEGTRNSCGIPIDRSASVRSN